MVRVEAWRHAHQGLLQLLLPVPALLLRGRQDYHRGRGDVTQRFYGDRGTPSDRLTCGVTSLRIPLTDLPPILVMIVHMTGTPLWGLHVGPALADKRGTLVYIRWIKEPNCGRGPKSDVNRARPLCVWFVTFTFRAFSRHIYPKRLTIIAFVRRKKNNNISLLVH